MTIAGGWLDQWMLPLFLTYCRIQSCLLVMPAFGERSLPVRIKITLALVLAPLFGSGAELDTDAWTIVLLAGFVASEVVLGLLMGLLVRLLAMALDIAATTIAMTASLSQIVGVPNEFAPHPIGNIMHLGGLALLMVLGFPLMLCDLIGESFILKPIGQWSWGDEFVPAIIGVVSRSFMLAMLLASPFILGGFLFQALSGVISKVMPSLPIVFIGAPAAILLALTGLAVFTPTILAVWADAVLTYSLPATR